MVLELECAFLVKKTDIAQSQIVYRFSTTTRKTPLNLISNRDNAHAPKQKITDAQTAQHELVRAKRPRLVNK